MVLTQLEFLDHARPPVLRVTNAGAVEAISTSSHSVLNRGKRKVSKVAVAVYGAPSAKSQCPTRHVLNYIS
jgi:hypothetical protein